MTLRCTYELGPVIGKGNDGQVVRAVNLETGKRVALKIMQRRVNPDDNLSEVFPPSNHPRSHMIDCAGQGDYMRRVQSKHIVKVEEVFRRGDMEYIVMELAEMDMLELVNGGCWFVLSSSRLTARCLFCLSLLLGQPNALRLWALLRGIGCDPPRWCWQLLEASKRMSLVISFVT